MEIVLGAEAAEFANCKIVSIINLLPGQTAAAFRLRAADMRVTAVDLTDGIRVDRATQKGSIYDVISVVTKAPSAYAVRILSRIQKHYPENMTKCHKLRINGKGIERQNTLCGSAFGDRGISGTRV